MKNYKFIEKNPKILGGSIVIKGTRVPLKRLYLAYRGDNILERIGEDYPHLNLSQVRDALKEYRQYIEKHIV